MAALDFSPSRWRVITAQLGVGTGNQQIPAEMSAAAFSAALARRSSGRLSIVQAPLVPPEGSSLLAASGILSSSPPEIVVVETNHFFRPRANRLSRELHEHFPGLEEARKRQWPELSEALITCTSAVALADNATPRYVVFARGPNLNPAKPDCLTGDGAVGRARELMEETYRELVKKN